MSARARTDHGENAARPVVTVAPATPLRPMAAEGRAKDAFIAGRLLTAYALNEQLADCDLRVDVRDGVVIVSGIVDDRVLRDLAADIAREIEGVDEVRCEIALGPSAPGHRCHDAFARRVRDASLAAQVRSRLLWNGDTHGEPIGVSCRDGVITLTGAVRKAEARDCAERLAAEVRHVLAVENQLQQA
jgi:osmotically-inducible protein OsmY